MPSTPSISIWLISILSLLQTHQAQAVPNCVSTPLQIPFGNLTLRSGVKAFGIPLTLGGQNFGLLPHPSTPLSFIQSIPKTCADLTDPASAAIECAKDPTRGNIDEVYLGGLLNTKQSGTYEGPFTWNRLGGITPEAPWSDRENRQYARDSVQFGDTLLERVAFMTSDIKKAGGVAEVNYAGLGNGSYLLDGLYEKGRVPSKTWGFWGGWTGRTLDKVQIGGLVLGGYDAAKLEFPGWFKEGRGMFSTVDDDLRHCSLRVLLKEVKVVDRRGEERTVLARGVEACIDPTFNSIELPRSVVEVVAGGSGIELSDEDLETAPGLYGGYVVPRELNNGFSLSFSLENDVKITVANHQLFSPRRQTTDLGYHILNLTKSDVFRLTPAIDENFIRLGFPFLSAAYILVNPEQEIFQVAQAIQSKVGETSLIAIRPTVCPGATNDQNPSVTGTSNDPSSESNSTTSSPPVPIPAIVGGVVGAIAILSISAFLGFYMHRRHQMKVLEDLNRERFERFEAPPPFEVEGRELHEGGGFTTVYAQAVAKPRSVYELPEMGEGR